LQHSEIDELREPFRAGQAGSSAMPQKRNPVKSERIAGFARLLRGYAAVAMENQALWHERDMSHSSAERIILPDATTLLHYALVSMRGIIDKMEVNRDAMRRNLDAGFGLHAASRLLTALINSGAAREAAYTLVQRASSAAREKRISLHQVAVATPEVTSALSPEALTAALDERAAIANCGLLVDRLKEIERAG
ncbi:MAG: hypothetical protein RLY94_293, partial [Chloroflexota bacterium]